MQKTLVMIGCIIFVLLLSSSGSALLSPSAHLQGTLNSDTMAFFFGQTSIDGVFSGHPMKSLINSPIVEDMNAFSLLGANAIRDLDSVIVAENIDISTANTLEELFLQYQNHITQYYNVDITTDNGLFLLRVTQGTLELKKDLSYAVTSFLKLNFSEDTGIPFFLTASLVPLTMQFHGDLAMLAQISDNGQVQLMDSVGKTLWSGNSKNNYLIIQDSRFSITQEPPLALIPLNPSRPDDYLHLSIIPADSTQINIPQLLKNISTSAAQLNDFNISETMSTIYRFDSIMTTASSVANAAMVLIQTNDIMMIDHYPQTFSGIGFARCNIMSVTYQEGSTGPSIEGESKLIFLGDHFYNPQANKTNDGIAFPFELLALWIVALCVFVYIRYFVRPDINEDKNDSIKRYALVFHVMILIIAFILMDREISDQFGTSAGDALFSQGFSSITGALLLFELIIWVLGFLILAIPVQLLTRSGLRMLSIGKGGKGISKGIGDLFIWVFCGLYLHLIINLFLVPFNLSHLLSLG